jgi:hypothetical protein
LAFGTIAYGSSDRQDKLGHEGNCPARQNSDRHGHTPCLRVSCCPDVRPSRLIGTLPCSVGGRAGGQQKFAGNPMDQDTERRLKNLKQAPRCGALTRSGAACQRPAIRGRHRCRLHGGLSPGAPRGTKNGNFRTGNWTVEVIQERKWLRSLVKAFASGV